MSALRKFGFVLFAVLAGALLSLMFDEASEQAPVRLAADSPLAQDYDYYVSTMSTTRFDAAGQPRSRLEAARMTHFPDGDITQLESPRFEHYPEGETAPWQVSALSGTFSPDAARDEDRLELRDEVVLRQTEADGKFLEARTSALTVFPDSQEIATAAPVTIVTTGANLDSTGMHALLEQDQVQLLNDVRGYHDPRARQP